MAKLVPIPLPDPDDPYDDDALEEPLPDEDEQPQKRRGLFRGKNANQGSRPKLRNPLSPNYNIRTATPQIDRDVPAGDTDEEATRSQWTHTDHTREAELTKLRCQNAARNRTDPLPRLIATERRLGAELELRKEATAMALEARDELLARLREPSSGDDASRRRGRALRHHAAKATGVATELKRREIAAREQLDRVSHHVDVIPDLVTEDVSIAIGHFGAWFEDDCSSKSVLVGYWRDRDATIAWGKDDFDELFGAPKIPTEAEIRERIRRLRGELGGGPADPASAPAGGGGNGASGGGAVAAAAADDEDE